MKSIQEAGGILRGEITDYRSFIVDRPTKRNPPKALAVYVGNDADLIEGKIYNVNVLSTGSLVAKDENGEAVICDKEDFLIVQFQPKAEKLLRSYAKKRQRRFPADLY